MNPSSMHDSLAHDTVAAAESLSAMIEKERTTYKRRDYLRPPIPQNAAITESDRLKIADWCYGVADEYLIDRETVATAVEMVDRLLSAGGAIAQDALRSPARFQLVALASFYVAIKTCETDQFDSGSFAEMSEGMYTVDDIEATEMDLLKGLSWRICAPRSVQIAHYILSLVLPRVDLEESTWCFILDDVRYQTELAVRDYFFAMHRASTIAIAAILNALDRVDREDHLAVLCVLVSIVNDDFDPLRKILAVKQRLVCAMEGNEVLPKRLRFQQKQILVNCIAKDFMSTLQGLLPTRIHSLLVSFV